jgi:hypothetical protein
MIKRLPHVPDDARRFGLFYLTGGAALIGFAAFFSYHRDWGLAAVNFAGGVLATGLSVRRLATKPMGMPRMTTCRWMLIVAIVAAVLGLFVKRRVDRFEGLALFSAMRARACLSDAAALELDAEGIEKDPEKAESSAERAVVDRFRADRLRTLAAAWSEYEQVFLRSARRPWELDPADTEEFETLARDK